MEAKNSIELINVRKVFADKNPKMAKLLPGFIYNYIERTIHQYELNDLITRNGQKLDVDFITASLEYFNITYELKGTENLPQNGQFIFASNHPLGGLDGLILMKAIKEKYGSVQTLANDILMNIKNLKGLFIPINKHGSHKKNAALKIDEAFASDVPILTFPAGLCSRKVKGKITDLEWKKNFITKAIQNKKDIVPIYFQGSNSQFFYNLSNIRKMLGIKVNIEMFYLPDEMFKHSNKKFTIYFGKPIPYNMFDKQFSHFEWAEKVKKHVYTLKDNVNAVFQ
jgi:putative hemolysin